LQRKPKKVTQFNNLKLYPFGSRVENGNIMTKKVNNQMTSKEFAAIAKNANKQIKEVTYSPFFIINTLNKVVKGDVSKINGLESINVEDVKKVASVCKTLHTGRYAFDFALFEKDTFGRWCTRTTLPKKYVFDTDGDSVTYTVNGKDVLLSDNVYLQPVTCTYPGMLSAFAKVAKVEIRETEKRAKEEKRAEEKAARAKETEEQKKARAAKKERETKVKELSLQLLAGEITPEDFAEKLAAIKAA